MKKFFAYEEIPVLVKDYILSVADADCIEQIPLHDINSFLYGQMMFEKERFEEYEDGWVE